MKNIKTLIPDIYSLFNPKTTAVPKDEDLEAFASVIKTKVKEKMAEATEKPRLRFSNVGKPCSRELWYTVNTPDKGEGFSPQTYIKFLFGDIIEALVLLLAKTAGHTVSDEQSTVEIDGIKGSTDGKINGVVVDVKSASAFSFKKFEKGLTKENDGFGYLTQLGLYNHGLGDKDSPAAFVAFDKQAGTLALDVHTGLGAVDYDKLVADRKAIVTAPEPPPRGFSDEPMGASGNRALKFNCSYCQFKRPCWPELRGYAYSRGPTFLTRTVKEPDVPRIF